MASKSDPEEATQAPQITNTVALYKNLPFQKYQQRVKKAVADIEKIGKGKTPAQQIREQQTKAIEELYKLFFAKKETNINCGNLR